MKRNLKSRYRGYDIVFDSRSRKWVSKKGSDEFSTDMFVKAMDAIDDRLDVKSQKAKV